MYSTPSGALLHRRFGCSGVFWLTWGKVCYALVQPYYHTQNLESCKNLLLRCCLRHEGLRPYRGKAQAATVISGRDKAHANRAAVANAVLVLLSGWCPLLLYLGQLVRECNMAAENNGTGSRAQEVLQLSLLLLWRLRCGHCDNILKYERKIIRTLLYSSKWHQDLPGQAHSEEVLVKGY